MIGHNGGFVARLRQGGCQTELRCGPPPARLHVLAVHWGRPKTKPPPSCFKWAPPVCSSMATLINSLIARERQCNLGQMLATQSYIHITAEVKSTEGQRELTLLENQPTQLEQRSSRPSCSSTVEKFKLCDGMRAEATCLLLIFQKCNATNYENIQSNYTLLPSVLLM